MDLRFDGRTAIVTGSARGIGFKVAELMVDSGAKVAMVDILADRLQESTKTLQAKGVAKPYLLDLTRVPDIKATVSKIRQEMGEIDVLIQAAAIGPSAAAEDITEEAWDKCFAVKTKELFFMMRQVVVQSMAPRKKGSIVNFSSIAGMKGMWALQRQQGRSGGAHPAGRYRVGQVRHSRQWRCLRRLQDGNDHVAGGIPGKDERGVCLDSFRATLLSPQSRWPGGLHGQRCRQYVYRSDHDRRGGGEAMGF